MVGGAAATTSTRGAIKFTIFSCRWQQRPQAFHTHELSSVPGGGTPCGPLDGKRLATLPATGQNRQPTAAVARDP